MPRRSPRPPASTIPAAPARSSRLLILRPSRRLALAPRHRPLAAAQVAPHDLGDAALVQALRQALRDGDAHRPVDLVEEDDVTCALRQGLAIAPGIGERRVVGVVLDALPELHAPALGEQRVVVDVLGTELGAPGIDPGERDDEPRVERDDRLLVVVRLERVATRSVGLDQDEVGLRLLDERIDLVELERFEQTGLVAAAADDEELAAEEADGRPRAARGRQRDRAHAGHALLGVIGDAGRREKERPSAGLGPLGAEGEEQRHLAAAADRGHAQVAVDAERFDEGPGSHGAHGPTAGLSSPSAESWPPGSLVAPRRSAVACRFTREEGRLNSLKSLLPYL